MTSTIYELCRDWAARPTVKVLTSLLDPLASRVAPVSELVDWLNGSGLHVITIAIVVTMAFLVGMLNLVMLVYIERKLLGRLMDRRGPMLSLASIWLEHDPEHAPSLFSGYGFLQNVVDGLKMFAKELIVPEKADKALYTLAPIIIVSSSVLLISLVPLSDRFVAFEGQAGLLFVMAVFGVAPVGILAAGWASNNKYTLIGGMRSAAQLMSYEIPLLLSMAGVFLVAGSFNPLDIVAHQQTATWLPGDLPMWNILPQFLGFCVFMVAILAEVERVPFDLPEAESELVEGWTTEYSGMRFGLFLAAEYIRGFIGCALAVILFLGGWAGPSITLKASWMLLGALGTGGLLALLFTAFAKPLATPFNQLAWALLGLIAGFIGGAVLTAGFVEIIFPALQDPLGLPELASTVTLAVLPPEIWFITKVWLLFVLFVYLRGTIPRVRTDQILELGWKRLMPLALLNLLLVMVMGVAYEGLDLGGMF